MIDTHSHLNFKAFEKDLDAVVKNAFDAGVTKIINVGAQIESSKKAVELADKHQNLFASVGIHPHHADKLFPCHPESHQRRTKDLESTDSSALPQNNKSSMPWNDNWLIELENLAKNEKVVAIGECGMDFYQYESNGITNPKLQENLFIKQIELSHKLKLPLIVHNRQAGDKIIEILLNHKSYLLNPPGVFHCFSETVDLLRKVLDLGFYVGFDGNITYKGLAKGETTSLKDLVKFAPVERILTETDAPYLTPIPHRGERNEPKYVIIVGKEIADIKGVSFEEIREKTTENAYKLFNLKPK